MNTNSSKQWRDYFEAINNQGRNYKLFIETAYGCHGSCAGCPISIENRSSSQPKWELNKLSEVLSQFSEHLLASRTILGYEPINNLALTVGPAENLYFDEAYLEGMGELAFNFSKSIQAEHFHLAVSTSGLFSEQKVENKILALRKHLSSEQLSFAFIINLQQFEKTPQHYFNFAKLLFQYTDLVELEINLDTHIHNIKADTLIKFGEFVNQFSFVQLDFAYAINESNSFKTYLKSNDFFEFIESLRNLTANDNRHYFSQWHEKLQPRREEDLYFQENFQSCYDNIVSSHIRLNAQGQWHFAKNIMGTLYYDDSLNIPSHASYLENPFDIQKLQLFKNKLFKNMNNILMQHAPCEACEWKNVCINSGFLNYSHFSPKDETICTNPGYTIFENIAQTSHCV